MKTTKDNPPTERLKTGGITSDSLAASSRNRVAASSESANDEWVVQCSRYLSLESVAGLSDNPVVSQPIMAN